MDWRVKMTSKYFADKLRKIQVDTPLTNRFEEEVDCNGKRLYAQLEKRWWDNSTGSQKEHLVCWFARKYCNGSTRNCIEDNYKKKCKYCYFVERKEYYEFSFQDNAKIVFNNMKRPEMYLWIAEALGILKEEKMVECINELKQARNNNFSWKEVINKYISWDDVEKKINLL